MNDEPQISQPHLTGGKGKGKIRGKGKSGPSKSKSSRAGLTFPVGRVARYLKEGRYAKRIGIGASVYMASILEYLTSELLMLAGDFAKEAKKSRISPRHIQLAISNDDEFSKYLNGVTVSQGGVMPSVESSNTKKKHED